MEELLSNLTLRRKSTFLMAMAQLITGEASEEEMEYLADIATMCEYPEDKFELIFNNISEDELKEMLRDFDELVLKRILVRELFYFAYTMEKVDEEKIAYIAFVADTLSLNADEVEAISDWVAVGIEWEQQGNALFGEGI